MTTHGICTSADRCPVHPGVRGIHPPWGLADPAELVNEFNVINAALEQAIPGSWDDDAAWSHIASEWIMHMAATHGAHCAGRHCVATGEMPAYVGALRRMWADSGEPRTGYQAGYAHAIRDLAHELGVDLDG